MLTVPSRDSDPWYIIDITSQIFVLKLRVFSAFKLNQNFERRHVKCSSNISRKVFISLEKGLARNSFILKCIGSESIILKENKTVTLGQVKIQWCRKEPRQGEGRRGERGRLFRKNAEGKFGFQGVNKD